MITFIHWIKELRIYQHGLVFTCLGVGLFFVGIFISKSATSISMTEVSKYINGCGEILLFIGAIEIFLFYIFSSGSDRLSAKVGEVDQQYFGKIGSFSIVIGIVVYLVVNDFQ